MRDGRVCFAQGRHLTRARCIAQILLGTRVPLALAASGQVVYNKRTDCEVSYDVNHHRQLTHCPTHDCAGGLSGKPPHGRSGIARRGHDGRASDDLPVDLNEAISPLSLLDDAALWRAARSRMADETAAQLEALHLKRQRDGLTATEDQTLAGLVRQYERVMLVRAQAAALPTTRP
jgi:hypothetical protein